MSYTTFHPGVVHAITHSSSRREFSNVELANDQYYSISAFVGKMKS